MNDVVDLCGNYYIPYVNALHEIFRSHTYVCIKSLNSHIRIRCLHVSFDAQHNRLNNDYEHTIIVILSVSLSTPTVLWATSGTHVVWANPIK